MKNLLFFFCFFLERVLDRYEEVLVGSVVDDPKLVQRIIKLLLVVAKGEDNNVMTIWSLKDVVEHVHIGLVRSVVLDDLCGLGYPPPTKFITAELDVGHYQSCLLRLLSKVVGLLERTTPLHKLGIEIGKVDLDRGRGHFGKALEREVEFKRQAHTSRPKLRISIFSIFINGYATLLATLRKNTLHEIERPTPH